MKWPLRWFRYLVHAIRQIVWSLLFGNMFHKGIRVSVVTPDFIDRRYYNIAKPEVVRCRAIVRGHRRGEDVIYARTHKRDSVVVRFADLDVTWCYGWREEDKKVLHAIAALEFSK